jgi:ribosomal peptide maturation radical SAM protein 1
MKQDTKAVELIVVPFLPVHQPALGVSSLAALLRSNGITASVRYLNIDYGKRIGWDLNSTLCDEFAYQLLVGDFIFTPALWGADAIPWDVYEERLCDWNQGNTLHVIPGLRQKLAPIKRLYDESPSVIAEWAARILRDPPRIAGFTSTFQQSIAALALAKEIRRSAPSDDICIMFGGANCEGDMGRVLSENFPFIDCVVSGEAENVIVGAVTSILAGAAERPVPRFIAGTMVTDMDSLPLPAFDDYFDAIKGTSWAASANLVAESSRGCWWGMKSHCTFCGLNGNSMAFRRKEGARFARELRTLSRAYGRKFFMLTDNIMDMRYLQTLFPELAASSDEIALFYETKANLRKEQVEIMAAGGVIRLQPGIESLSTPILTLMGKGTTRLQNIQLLKWTEEFKLGLSWNFLFGFPGEPIEDYAAMASLIPVLIHLPAPTGYGAVRIDRFSPYWRTPEQYGLKRLTRYWPYDLVYAGLDEPSRERVAYCFDAEDGNGHDPWQYAAPVIAQLNQWRASYEAHAATLEIIESDGAWTVIDSRFSSKPAVHPLTSREALLLREFDAYAGLPRALTNANAKVRGPQIELAEAEAMLRRFAARQWIAEENGHLLSLILDRSEHHRVIDRKVSLMLGEFGLPAEPPPTDMPAVFAVKRGA